MLNNLGYRLVVEVEKKFHVLDLVLHLSLVRAKFIMNKLIRKLGNLLIGLLACKDGYLYIHMPWLFELCHAPFIESDSTQ